MDVKRILIIEDDEFLQQIYTDTLKEGGYEVTLARDGGEGLQQLSQGGWDLVLLDMILPKLTGVEILRKVRATPPVKANKKIIVASNLDEGADFKEAKGLADGYIVKSSLTPGELLEKVKGYLSS